MALDPSTTDACSLINTPAFPTLFVKQNASETTAYPLIARGGVQVKFSESLNAANLANNVLNNPSMTSQFRLIQFLSGAGITVIPGVDYSKLKFIALSATQGTAPYESIIDTYIAPQVGTYLNPTFNSSGGSLLTPAQFWNPSESVDGVITNPRSALGKLIAAGHLLSESQIYIPSQVSATEPPTPGNECLIYLYNLAQRGTLTPAQKTLQNKIEATNLRFFGAYMVEYCFYRTRYEWLLNQYFTIYMTSTTGAGSYQTAQPNAIPSLFGTGTGNSLPSTSTSASLTQIDYLTGLAFQMACLNMRMADMKSLLTAVNTYYNGVFIEIQTNINSATQIGSNTKLTQTINSLQTSAKDANKYLIESDFAQEAMNYNSEKNRYSNILLGLYAFLNIAALATVFHLARN